MNTNEKQIWFRAKKYGWGWGPPCSWQGWVVFAVWLVLLGGGGFFLAPRSTGLFVGYAIFLCIPLFIVLLIKGEKPRWRWGKD
jgi:drug/metabolite transporter (DMT)-like permease